MFSDAISSISPWVRALSRAIAWAIKGSACAMPAVK